MAIASLQAVTIFLKNSYKKLMYYDIINVLINVLMSEELIINEKKLN